MKLKREIIIISLIIAVLFTVSSVCAGDSEIQAIGTHNSTDELMSTANDNNLKMNDANEILAETDDGNFTALNAKISGASGTVTLENNYTWVDSDGSTITDAIEITANDLVIDGNGFTVDAKGHPIFKVSADGVTIKNIRFVNGASTNQKNGGAITWIGDQGNLLNCYFNNNVANAGYSGGAVYCSDNNENFIIKNCTFISNKVTGTCSGGAVFTESYYQSISNCTFINNTGTYAGAIELYYAPCVIDKCIFVNNTGTYAGAIDWTVYGGGRLTNSIFLNNGQKAVDYTDAYSGQYSVYANYNWFGTTDSQKPSSINAGIKMSYWLYLDMDVNDYEAFATVSLNNLNNGEKYQSYALPEFTFDLSAINAILDKTNITIGSTGENTVNYEMKQPKGYLTVSSDDVSLTKEIKLIGNFTKLKNDIVNSQESVIKLEHDYKYNPNTDSELTNGVEITKSITIDGQGCTIDASGLKNIFYLNDNTKELVLKNIKFVNAVGSEGAAVYAKANKVTIINCSFIGNDASDSVVFIDSTTQSDITNSIFINNNGLNVKGNDNVVADYNWWGNTAENINADISNVEGVAVTKWYYLDVTFEKDISTISLNKLNDGSSYEGYISSLITLNLDSKNMTLDAESVTLEDDGKATCGYELTQINGSLTVQYENIEFTKNTSFVDDGSFSALQFLIKINPDNQVLNLTKDYSYNPSLDGSLTTGIVLTKDITIDGKGHTLDAKEFVRIFVLNDASKNLVLKNLTFINAKSTRGGAVYSKCTSIEVYDCNFINNTATAAPGGAVEVNGYGSKFVNCTFINNSAPTAKGGAVYITEQGGENDFYDCTFINNYASQNGGAISTTGGQSLINITKCIFAKNSVSSSYYSGVDVYLYGSSSSKIYINNSIFLKKIMTETKYPLYVSYAPNEYSIDNNWWGDTVDTYDKTYTRAGSNTNINSLLYLDITYEDEVATISINNLYASGTTSAYDGELPQITFNLSGTNILIDDNLTLDNKGVGEIDYDLTDQTGSLTASYYTFSLTKSLTLEDSFTTLQNKVNRASEGSELVLAHDYNYNSPNDDGLIGGIVIDKDLTIDGQGHTLDAKDASRIFKIDDNSKNIVFKNIRFTNARAADGAAIYANCNNIEIINCTFEANEATNNGDALYIIANGCDITESAFVNNLGTQSALYLASDLQDAPFNMDNSIFVNNAGANIVKDDKIALTANYNWWGNTVDNTADLSGGLAQNWYLLDMNVDNTKSIATISLNNLWDGSVYSPCETYALPTISADIQTNAYASARKDKVNVGKDGDAVGYIVTDENNVASITVSYNGVSLTREINYNEESDYSFKALKKLIDAAQDKDIIELAHDYEYVIGYDDITAGIDIIQDNLTINVNGYTIDAKEQTRIFNVGSSGYIYGSNVTIKNATFANGKMSANGGAISWYGGEGNLANCTFVNNTVTSSSSTGGAVYIQSNNMKVFNVTFSENKATSKGGAIYIFSNNVTINQSTFVKNDGGSNGGAIYWGKSDVGTIIDSTFIDNHANYQGGALETDSNADDITVINSTFTNNKVTSTGKGGAIYWGNTNNRKIINSTFINNYASSQGGALYWYTMNEPYNGILYNSTFINNTALNGGAIYIFSGRLDIDESDFINNTATGSSTAYGGAIYAGGDSLNINNTDFIGNAAKASSNYGRGGALYVSSNYGKMNINNSTFIKNSAYSTSSTSGGGVMYVATNCNITNSTFISNSATVGGSSSTYGGVFYWYGAKGNISKSVFIDNTAKTYGGVIYGSQSASKMNVTNSIFINNKLSTYNSVNVMNSASSGFYNFTECWFGNTRLDGYTPKGLSTNNYVKSNRPLCLELDSYDELMIVDDDKELSYYFNYVEDGTKHDYDSSKLPEVNLTLSTVKADVDKNHALVDETILFNANQYGSVSMTAKFYDLEYTEELTAKLKVIITVDENPIVVHVGEHKELTGISLDPATLSYATSVAEGDEYIELDNQFRLVGLKEGESIITITTSGDSTHAPTTLKVPVKVIKYTTEFVTLIDSNPVDSIVVDWGAEPQSIQVGFITDDPNPDFTDLSFNFESNDTKVAKFSTNPSLITFGAAGTANITFSTQGNERYYGSEKNFTVTVRKVASSIDLSKTDLEFGYGGSDSTALTLVGCSVDDVNITVEGHTEAVIGFENNVITVYGLDAGTYTLKVTSTPDANHTSVTETADITVTKVDSSVEFENNVEFDYLGTGNTKLINFVGCSVDLVNITVEGQTGATVDYDDVTKVITVSGLDAGTYTLKVTTTPDSNHNSVDVTADITVNKIDSSVTFGDIEFDYLGSGTTTITDYDGCTVDLVNITVVGQPNAVIGFENDVITVSGLKAGTHQLKVVTTPDSNHKSVPVTKNVKVNKIPSQITLNSTDMVYEYDESNATKLTLVGCSVDLINITVDGNNVVGVTYDSETQVITLSGIDVGTHELKVVTTPDENHTSVYSTASVTVEVSNSSVTFSNPISFYYSESGTTILTLNGCSVDLDKITVVDHSEANITYDSQTNVITVSNLDTGNYILKVITTPDSNHLSVEKTTTIEVGKVNPQLSMEYSNVTVGENELVYVSMGAAGDVNVTIFKGTDVNQTKNVTIGATGFNKTIFTGLNVGEYNITAYYKGQGIYNDSTLKYKLVIRPIYEYEFSASVNNTVMGNKTNVTVNLPSRASGNITIGNIVHPVEGTKTIIELPEQTKLGRNNITVKYVPDEDSKYASRELTVVYDVSKVDTEIALTVVNKTTADPVTITAAIKAEGNVTFIINGKKYSREIKENVATLELLDVAGGEYNVTAVYEGSEKYNYSTVNAIYTVEKINSTISIDVTPNPIKTDESATVTVNVEGSGIVTFNVNGVETNVTVDGGVATLNLEKLAKGTTSISAKYLGSDKYNTNETSEITLTVNPVTDYEFTLDIANITVGENAIAYIFLPSDATNKTNITVTRGNNIVLSENATLKLTIPDLKVGTYNITAKYYGDDKYGEKTIVNEFTVNPLNVGKLNFTVSVDDTVLGNTTNLTVNLPDDATGYLVIGEKNETIKGTVTVIELPAPTTAGLNNVTVRYVPDDKSRYGEENVTAFYNVAKKIAKITIDTIDVKAGGNVTVNATAYDGANIIRANIIIYIDGEKTSTIENISAGKHTVVAEVAETDEYLSATANKTFEVTKSDIGTFVVFAKKDLVYVGEKAEIYVKVINDDVSGAIIVNVNGTEYSLNITGTDNILKVEMNNIGEITLSARYLGNYKYNAKDAEGSNLTVIDKETPEITIQTDSLVVVGQEMTINVTDFPDLIVTINGNPQTVTAGKFNYTPLKDGAYTIIARTGENENHYAAEAIASFTVMNKTKESPSIVISEISDAKVGKEFNFTVTAIGGGDAVVKINDVIIPITDGVYKYTPQKSGTFTLTVETPENDKYSKGVNITTFDVDKNEVDLKVSADSVLVGQTATITVDITEEATGIVVIIVNGTEYSLDISGDKKSLDVLMANVGNVTLSAKYLGDDKYNAKDADSSVIEVSDKADSIIEINDINLDIGKPTNPLTAKVNGVDCADIVFTINGVEGISIDKVEAVTYTITATFKGNATHKANTTSKVYAVNKTKSELSIIPPSTISIDEPITFEINSGDRDDAVVYIDGKEYPVINSAVVFTNPTAGTHTIIASLNETDKYLSANDNLTFNVDKKDSSIEIESSAGSAIVGETVTIYITPISGADGIVLLNVNGTVYSLTTKDRYYDIVLDKAGTYTINATYVGSDIFKSNSSNVETIEVSEKEISNIDIQIPEVNLVGEDIVINITSDVTPEVYVDGRKQNYKDGKVIVSDLKAGNHTIDVITPETEDYKANSTVKSFNVDKKDSAIEISASASEAYVGSELTITVSPTSGADGSVLVNVDGTVYSLTLPDKELKVVLDKVSTYSINATYAGSDIYKPSSSKVVKVEVKDKTVPSVDVQIPEVNVVGEDVVIKITSDVDPEVYVDGEKQVYKDGQVIVSGLDVGSHLVEVTTPETAASKASSVAKSLAVSKKQSSIEIISIEGDKLVDSSLKVNLKYEGNNVIVYLDGDILSNYGSFKASAGTHTITAGVAEDDEYLSSTANATFEILKNNVDIDVSGSHATIGEKSTITVDIVKDATGIVVVNVDGTEYSINISKTNSFDVVFNEPGEYDITATYIGDDKYGSAKAADTVVIYDKKEADIEIIIPSETIYAGDDVVVFVYYVGDANLTATVDGIFTEIEDGQFTIENVGAGTHTIEVRSPETKEYREFTSIEIFEAIKYSSEVSINVPHSIKAGQDVEVEITSYDGADIIVTLDGAKQTLNEGKLKFTASAGNHTISASVAETDTHLANYSEETFTVTKLDAAIKVSGTDITQGQATTITINTDLDEGIVVVKLNDTEIAVDIAKSKSASVVLDTPGVYKLSASYLGSDIYNTAVAENSTINVASKVTPEVKVDVPEIKAGESETISVSIPNATGNVHVIVDGVEQVIPLDENGNAKYTIPEMGAGSHSVVVVYPGDDTHEAKVVAKKLDVPKQSSKASVTVPSDVKEGENATVEVDIPGATGTVSVIIDGKETTVPLVGGKANYTIPDMDAGNHGVVVIYPGDDKNDATYSVTNINVEGEVIVPKLATEFTNINIESDLTIHAMLKDSEGNPVAGATINYSVLNVAGTVKTGSDGSFIVKGANNAVVSLLYDGSDKLEPTNITIKLETPLPTRVSTQFNVSSGYVVTSYAVEYSLGERGTWFDVRLTDENGKPITDETVQFGMNSVVLNMTTDANGVSSRQINYVKANTYTLAVCYLGNVTHEASFIAVKVIVNKKPITISAPAKTYKANDKTKTYTVTLKTIKNVNDGKTYLKANKKVVMKLNGKKYVAFTNSKGQATFNLNINKKGKFTASLSFAGDDTYLTSKGTAKITIN